MTATNTYVSTTELTRRNVVGRCRLSLRLLSLAARCLSFRESRRAAIQLMLDSLSDVFESRRIHHSFGLAVGTGTTLNFSGNMEVEKITVLLSSPFRLDILKVLSLPEK